MDIRIFFKIITAVSNVLTAVLIIFPVLGALLGLARRPRKDHASLLLTITAAAIAFAGAMVIRGRLPSLFTSDLAAKIIGGSGFEDLVLYAPTAMKYIGKLLTAVLMPFIFSLLFVILRLLFLPFNALVAKIFRHDKPKRFAGRLAGAGMGLIGGFIIAVILVTPISGTADMLLRTPLAETADALIGRSEEAYFADPGFIRDIEAKARSPILRLANACGGRAAYSALTSFGTDSGKTSLEEQITSYERLVTVAAGLTGPDAVTSESVRALTDAVRDNPELLAVTAELISAAGEKWADGQNFCNISPDVPGIPEGFSDTLFGIMKNTTAETLRDGGLDVLGDTVEASLKISDMVSVLNEGKKDEDAGRTLEEDIGWLAENIDGKTKEIISGQITPVTLISYGLPERSAEGVAELINNVLDEMVRSDAKNTREEAEAITAVYDIAVHTDFSSGNIFGEGGLDAGKVVGPVMNSEIISKAVIKTATGENGSLKKDPLNTGANYSPADKSLLEKAINSQLSSWQSKTAAERDELGKRALAVASVLGLEGTLSEGGVFAAK